MNNILDILEKRLNSLNWITSVKNVQNMLKVTTQEGIEYICKAEHKENETIIIVKDCALNFCYENKFSNSMTTDDFYRDFIVVGTEAEILKNEICLKSFKKGLTDFKEKNQVFNLDSILDTSVCEQYKKDNKIANLAEYLWNKGYEFSSKYPYPEEVDKQYNYIAERTNNISSVLELRKFMEKNPDINTYLDEKEISEDIDSLNTFREIEYSYKNIVAKTYISIGRLNEKILVFDTEGINEVANCHIEDYKDVYKSKLIEVMFKEIEICKDLNKKMKLIQLLKPGEGIDFDICDNIYDFEVAFVMNDEEPKDNYDKYLRYLAENLDVINVKNKAGNIVVDLDKYVRENIKMFVELFEDDDIENNIDRTMTMISGNSSETVYKKALEYLGVNTIEEEKEENEQEK